MPHNKCVTLMITHTLLIKNGFDTADVDKQVHTIMDAIISYRDFIKLIVLIQISFSFKLKKNKEK